MSQQTAFYIDRQYVPSRGRAAIVVRRWAERVSRVLLANVSLHRSNTKVSAGSDAGHWRALPNFVARRSIPIRAQRSDYQNDVIQQSCNCMPRGIAVRHQIL